MDKCESFVLTRQHIICLPHGRNAMLRRKQYSTMPITMIMYDFHRMLTLLRPGGP